MQDELFFLEHYKKVAALAALPEGGPKREAAIQRLWALARKGEAPWCAETVDAPSRDNPFAESKAGLLLGGLGVIVVLGMYGLDRLGVDPRLCLALGTLGLIALAAGAALYAARYRRTQERNFRRNLDAFLARASALPPERLKQLGERFGAMNRAARNSRNDDPTGCGCVDCGHLWTEDPRCDIDETCPACKSGRVLYFETGMPLTSDDLRDIRALLP